VDIASVLENPVTQSQWKDEIIPGPEIKIIPFAQEYFKSSSILKLM
jgi:hypothetical protein